MKQYKFSLDKLVKALDTSMIIENTRYRMISIKKVIENRDELGIDEYYCDKLYNEYLELEKEIVKCIRKFYDDIYKCIENYDNNLDNILKLEEDN